MVQNVLHWSTTMDFAAGDEEEMTKPTGVPLHGARIEDYAMIGDCETAALVSREGSIDWLCWPSFSSNACFAALLGTKDHGMWSIAPVEKILSSRRRYLPQTLVLETIVETESGVVRMLDFMPPREPISRLIRTVECLRGKVRLHMDLVIRFDYGRTIPWVSMDHGTLRAIAGPDMVVLQTTAKVEGRDLTTVCDFTLRSGEAENFCLEYTSSLAEVPKPPDYAAARKQTVDFWLDWMTRCTYRGAYQEAVDRSLITLKALTYKPTGGIVAAPTTSLPEWIGSERNWDYRYCWLRDTAFTLLVLIGAGYEDEAVAWRRWLLRAVAGGAGAGADALRYRRRAAAAGVEGGLAARLRALSTGADWQRSRDAVSARRVWRGSLSAAAHACRRKKTFVSMPPR